MHEIKKKVTPNMCKNFRDSKEKFRFVFKHSTSTHQLRENCTYGEKSHGHMLFWGYVIKLLPQLVLNIALTFLKS